MQVLQLCRRMEKVWLSLSSHFTNLKFNHTCNKLGILPKSLRFAPPLRNKQGFKLAEKFGWRFLSLKISECHKFIKLKSIEIKKKTMKTQLSSILRPTHLTELENTIKKIKQKKEESKVQLHEKRLSN